MSIKQLLEGKELSEEFVTEAEAVFEQAVEEKASVVIAEKVAELEEKTNTAIAEKMTSLEAISEQYITEEVIPNIDKYLSAAVNEWLEENTVALEATSKVELAESFLNGMKGLVESHNFEVPESEKTLVDEMKEEVESLKSKLNEMTDKNISLNNEITEGKKASLTESLLADKTETQREKLVPVIENLEYKNDDQYTTAVKSLVESYFPEVDKPALKEDKEEDGKEELVEGKNDYLAALIGQFD